LLILLAWTGIEIGLVSIERKDDIAVKKLRVWKPL